MASGSKTTLLEDPRYNGFVERYVDDIPRFCIEVCGLTPTWQQLQLFESVQKPGSRTSVSSGHGSGKTQGYAVCVLWHLTCYKHSNTILSGPKLDTVQNGVRKYVSDLMTNIREGLQAWIAEHIIVEYKTIYILGFKSQWWCVAKTAPAGKPESLAGEHRKFLLWLIDEASGIPDKNFGVIMGSLTEEWNRIALASQPTKPSGYFYETHNRLSSQNGGPWTALTFSSEESPLVSDKFIREKLIEYGGRQSPEYQIKVLGLFPENSDKYLLGKGVIQARIDGPDVIYADEPYGNLLIIDVAAGVHRDKTVATHVRVIGDDDRVGDNPRRIQVMSVPLYTNALDWTPVARIATDFAATLSNCVVVVDCGGQGIQFAKRMEEFGCPNVEKVNWGLKPFKKRNKDRFFNLRAQCCVHAAEAVRDGRIKFTTDYQADLLDQGSRIPFFIDERGLWHIQKKEDMAKDGIPSPDFWDTICMAFMEGINYMQAEATSSIVSAAKLDSARQAAIAELADVE